MDRPLSSLSLSRQPASIHSFENMSRMRSSIMRSYLRIVVPAVFLAACGSGTEPTPPDPLLTALQQVSWGEFNNYQNHVITPFLPPTFPVSAYLPRNCQYASTDQAFACPAQTT